MCSSRLSIFCCPFSCCIWFAPTNGNESILCYFLFCTVNLSLVDSLEEDSKFLVKSLYMYMYTLGMIIHQNLFTNPFDVCKIFHNWSALVDLLVFRSWTPSLSSPGLASLKKSIFACQFLNCKPISSQVFWWTKSVSIWRDHSIGIRTDPFNYLNISHHHIRSAVPNLAQA